MNKQRRKAIEKLREKIAGLLDENVIEEIAGEISDLRDEEQEAYDALPESIQQGERGDQMQSAIDALEGAHEALRSVLDAVNEVTGGLDSALEG